MTNPAETIQAMYDVLLEMDFESEGTLACSRQLFDAIAAGKIPGLIVSAPPCARMCEARAVKLTMEQLRGDLAAALAEVEAMRKEWATATADCARYHGMFDGTAHLLMRANRERDEALAKVAQVTGVDEGSAGA